MIGEPAALMAYGEIQVAAGKSTVISCVVWKSTLLGTTRPSACRVSVVALTCLPLFLVVDFEASRVRVGGTMVVIRRARSLVAGAGTFVTRR